MNVTELAEHLAAKRGITKSDAKETIETVFAAITEAAVGGDEVSVPAFGKFKVASRAAREGRNPATGATIKIAASKKLSFTPAKALKDALNPPTKKPAKGKK
jgi:DNA-binding protein HU-beta